MSIWSWVRRDGLLHMETCALIAVVFGLFSHWWLAGIISLVAGIGKEVWDRYNGGVPSWHDIICDLIGIVVGTAIAFL